jgi:hypothetical protein
MPSRNHPIITPAQRVQNFLAPAPNTQYGDVLPLARGPDGSLRLAMPNMVRDSLQSTMRLMNVPFGGDVLPQDVLAAGMSGSLGAGVLRNFIAKSAAEIGENAASRSVPIYNPPRKPPRPFEADYPSGAPVNAEGRLTHDIEGRPLYGRYVVGRNVAGDDQALPPTEFNALAEATTGRSAQVVSPRQMGQDFGRLVLNRYTRQPLGIELRSGLSPEVSQRVLGHELGHAIDEATGQIDTKGLNKQLRSVYNTLNNGYRSPDGAEAASWSKPATPQGFGYKSADVPREQMAEAIRAYLADPNYLKTVAPDVAARIRESVNSHPELSKIIQFNAAPPLPLAPWEDDPIISPAPQRSTSPFANWFGGPEA